MVKIKTMGVQKNIKQLQEQVNILSGALFSTARKVPKISAEIQMVFRTFSKKAEFIVIFFLIIIF